LHRIQGWVVAAGFLSRGFGIFGKSGGNGLPKHNGYEKLLKSLARVVFDVFG
jgi:hypothetical protein